MNESEIQQLIQIDAVNFNCVLMRNNSGALKDINGRLVRYGLGQVSSNQKIKSSDLIGITCLVISPEMVGHTVAVFTAVECKHPDWKPSSVDARERAQAAFIAWVRARGGFAGFANSIESFRKIMGK